MQINRNYSKKTLIKISLVVVFLVFSGSFAGFMWFKQSENWSEIEKIIMSHPLITHEAGEVDNVSLSYFGFSYKFSGEWAETNLMIDVDGSNTDKTYELKAERNKGAWQVVEISSQ